MNPKQKLEQAAKAFVIAGELATVASTSIYKSVENPTDVNDDENTGEVAQKVHPSVTVEAEGNHEEFVPFSNVFRGPLSVTVEADASSTTDEEFDEICAEVFALFDIVELKANLSASLEDFTVQFAQVMSVGSAINNGQNWQAQMMIDVAYAESDFD